MVMPLSMISNTTGRYLLWSLEKFRAGEDPKVFAHEQKGKKKIRGFGLYWYSDYTLLMRETGMVPQYRTASESVPEESSRHFFALRHHRFHPTAFNNPKAPKLHSIRGQGTVLAIGAKRVRTVGARHDTVTANFRSGMKL